MFYHLHLITFVVLVYYYVISLRYVSPSDHLGKSRVSRDSQHHLAGLVWFFAAGTTVTSRAPTGDSTCTLLRITPPSSSTVASEEFGIHIRSGDLKLQQGWVLL